MNPATGRSPRERIPVDKPHDTEVRSGWVVDIAGDPKAKKRKRQEEAAEKIAEDISKIMIGE